MTPSADYRPLTYDEWRRELVNLFSGKRYMLPSNDRLFRLWETKHSPLHAANVILQPRKDRS